MPDDSAHPGDQVPDAAAPAAADTAAAGAPAGRPASCSDPWRSAHDSCHSYSTVAELRSKLRGTQPLHSTHDADACKLPEQKKNDESYASSWPHFRGVSGQVRRVQASKHFPVAPAFSLPALTDPSRESQHCPQYYMWGRRRDITTRCCTHTSVVPPPLGAQLLWRERSVRFRGSDCARALGSTAVDAEFSPARGDRGGGQCGPTCRAPPRPVLVYGRVRFVPSVVTIGRF